MIRSKLLLAVRDLGSGRKIVTLTKLEEFERGSDGLETQRWFSLVGWKTTALVLPCTLAQGLNLA